MLKEMLKERLEDVMQKIDEAAERSGRRADDIELVAVSKQQPVERIAAFKELGLNLFGESRAQELQEKAEKLQGVSWDFIGHLQRNKVKYLMRMDSCRMIHSLDSWRLAREIDKRAAGNNRVIPVLIEINITGDDNKYGISPDRARNFAKRVQQLNNIDLQGLMTIAPYVNDPEETRSFFRRMAELRYNLVNAGIELPHLSMGMTNDYEVAIEEGATLVRIGTGLFGKR